MPAVNRPKSTTSRVLEYNINRNAGEVIFKAKLIPRRGGCDRLCIPGFFTAGFA